MKVRFNCPECQATMRAECPSGRAWTCSRCGFDSTPPASEDEATLTRCRVCGHPELYARKAFPHWLGMAIVAAASLGFLVFHAAYWFTAAWLCLVGAFLLDVVLYFVMGTVAVCYRCNAEHKGFAPANTPPGFELAIAERHRQERLRRQGMGPSR